MALSLPNLLKLFTFRLVLNENLFHGAAISLDLVGGEVLEEDGVAVPAEVLVVLGVGAPGEAALRAAQGRHLLRLLLVLALALQ